MKQIITTCLLCVLAAGLFAAEPAKDATTAKKLPEEKFKSRKIRLGRVEYTSQTKLAKQKYRREMEKLQQKQTEVLNAAREKFVKLLEAEKLAVMKAGDLPEAVKIDNAIKALKNPAAAIAAGVSPAGKNKGLASVPVASAKEIKKLDGYARVLPDCIAKANDLKKTHYAGGGGSEWNLATKELLLGQYNRMISTLRKIHAKIKKDKKLQQKYAGALSTFAGQLRNHGASFLGDGWMQSSSDPQKIEADVRRLRKKISGFPTGKGGAERRKMKYKRPR